MFRFLVIGLLLASWTIASAAERQQEKLDRGLVAIRQDDGHVWLSWRMFASDPANVAFHVYRSSPSNGQKRLTTEAIADVTWFIDRDVAEGKVGYFVRPIVNGKEQGTLPTAWLDWTRPQQN